MALGGSVCAIILFKFHFRKCLKQKSHEEISLA